MDETPEQQHTFRWMTAVICSVFVLLIAMGGVFALRDRLSSDAREEARKQTFEREKLAARITSLESAVEALKIAPQQDSAALDAKLATISESLADVGKRLDALEKPAEVKKPETTPASAPEPASADATATRLKLAALSGKTFATELAEWSKAHPQSTHEADALSPFATGGIPTEAELTRTLVEALGTKPEGQLIEDQSLVGKINMHLKGLVSIKKSSGEDAYSTLRKETASEDLATLERHALRLSDAERAPLEDWLKQVKDRRAALDALDAITRNTSN